MIDPADLTAPPLTHQELLAHAGAFVRAGWRVDLAACDRALRRLVLQPRTHGDTHTDAGSPSPSAGLPPGVRVETLWLDDLGDGDLRLTRRLQVPGLPAATVQSEGPSVPELVQRLEALPHSAQFERAGILWWSLALRLDGGGRPPVLRAAEARLSGLQLKASVTSVRGYDAELNVQRLAGPADSPPRELPDDLFEVLGRAFGRLTPTATGWRSSISLAGGEPGRSQQARERLARLLAHLQHTLASPPAAFHKRHGSSRWGVSLRRSLPLGLGLSLVGLALWGAQRADQAQAWLGALANGAPPLLLALLFMRREMLRLELPRWPRAPAADAWQAAELSHHSTAARGLPPS